LGADDPLTIYERMKELAEKTKIDWEMHCHNDLGMAVACSVAGAKGIVDGGQDAYINTTINGMGERAGNADLLSVLLALKYASGLKEKGLFPPEMKLNKIWAFAKYASYAFGIPIPVNQVGVGANAFAHESGIHADGALKNRRNYELYDYEELGRGEPELVESGRMITVGEYSGIKGFRNVYGNLEVEFKSDEEASRILELVRYANVHTQKPLTKEELLFVAKYPDQVQKILTVTPT
jgi:homocitrate synthase NifV